MKIKNFAFEQINKRISILEKEYPSAAMDFSRANKGFLISFMIGDFFKCEFISDFELSSIKFQNQHLIDRVNTACKFVELLYDSILQ